MRQLTPEEQEKFDSLTDPNSVKPKFGWDDTFQRKLLGMLLTDSYMVIQSLDKVVPGYFSNECHVIVCTILMEHFQKHKAIPEKFIIEQELKDRTKDKDAVVRLHFLAEFHSVYDYYVPGLETREYLLDKITYFAKVQSLKMAFGNSMEKIAEAPEDEKTWNFVYEEMRKSMLIDRSYEPGLQYFNELDEMYRRMEESFIGKDRFTSGFAPIDEALTGGGMFPGQIASWIGLPGTGKTSLKFTKILMHDGSIKFVQDIAVGDLVMGDDSTPRKVLATHSLMDWSYEIRPAKGNSYFVNSGHILSLKSKSDEICNLSVEDWLKESEEFREGMSGWRTGVEFPHREVETDPCELGIIIGSAKDHSCKFIPHEYKVNSKEIRLSLLFGLLNSGGKSVPGGIRFSSASKLLIGDICFLARSLGFPAYEEEAGHAVCVVGEGQKEYLKHGIQVLKTGKFEEFYGFETDGNHLFLLADFTVVHNSLALVKAAVSNVILGHKVLYITMEMNELGIAQRFTSQFAKKDINNLRGVKDDVYKTIEDFKNGWEDSNLLQIKQFPGGTMDVNGIRGFMAQLALRKWKPNLLILDYVGEMKDNPAVKKYESAYLILRDLRAFGIESNHCTFTCVQPNASAAKLEIGQFIDESNIGTSFDQFKPLDAFWSINQQVVEKEAEVGRVFVIKHRDGKSRFPFKIGFDYSLGTLDMFAVTKDKYREQMNIVQEKKAGEVGLDVIDVGPKKVKKFKGSEPETYEA